MVPIKASLQMAVRGTPRFECFAIAQPLGALDFDRPQAFEATMLILPLDSATETSLTVGTSCRICSEAQCPARREASILADGL